MDYTDVDRRTVLRGLGGLAVAGTLAGCSTSDGGGGDGGDGGDGGSGGDGGDGGGGGGNAQVDDYLSETSNYDGIEDMTGQSSVTVEVGAQGNGGAFAFAPAAIRVDTGTTVTWEWTGEGGGHNVKATEGADFESETVSEAGHTFEHTFESSGTVLYECTPHASLGMLGAVVVE